MNETAGKLGVIMSGGGARAAYQVGGDRAIRQIGGGYGTIASLGAPDLGPRHLPTPFNRT